MPSLTAMKRLHLVKIHVLVGSSMQKGRAATRQYQNWTILQLWLGGRSRQVHELGYQNRRKIKHDSSRQVHELGQVMEETAKNFVYELFHSRKGVLFSVKKESIYSQILISTNRRLMEFCIGTQLS